MTWQPQNTGFGSSSRVSSAVAKSTRYYRVRRADVGLRWFLFQAGRIKEFNSFWPYRDLRQLEPRTDYLYPFHNQRMCREYHPMRLWSRFQPSGVWGLFIGAIVCCERHRSNILIGSKIWCPTSRNSFDDMYIFEAFRFTKGVWMAKPGYHFSSDSPAYWRCRGMGDLSFDHQKAKTSQHASTTDIRCILAVWCGVGPIEHCKLLVSSIVLYSYFSD